MSNKYTYVFGPSKTEGAADMRNLLGGKGANLAEMCRLGISVPPGLTTPGTTLTISFAGMLFAILVDLH